MGNNYSPPLTGLTYRAAQLDIRVEGIGDQVADVHIDGKRAQAAMIPASARGAVCVEIRMKGGCCEQTN
jgi:hypothetical protein